VKSVKWRKETPQHQRKSKRTKLTSCPRYSSTCKPVCKSTSRNLQKKGKKWVINEKRLEPTNLPFFGKSQLGVRVYLLEVFCFSFFCL
jgi:hypothetical protein